MKKLLLLALALLILTGCGSDEPVTPPAAISPDYTEKASALPEPPDYAAQEVMAAIALEQAEAALRERAEQLENAEALIEAAYEYEIPVHDFILWLESDLFPDVLAVLAGVPDSTGAAAALRARTGNSLHVLADMFSGLTDDTEAARAAGIHVSQQTGSAENTVLAVAGDVCLTDGGFAMKSYKAAQNGLSDIFPDGLLEEMRAADIFLINNEFAFSKRGSPIPTKEYTFRSDPENVGILVDMGVDIACLANNHIFDYGEDAMLDTFDTLDKAGIARFGAGRDIEDASRPVYYIVNGIKIAFIGASCIDIRFTQVADTQRPGVLRARENNADILLEVIRDARIRSDYVIVNFHWGFENTSKVETYQRQLAQMSIDAGADIILGGHPHVLQGTEFYNGKPIVYSMGNFWFSSTYRQTGLLKIFIDYSGEVTLKLIPAELSGGKTTPARGETGAAILDYYESISFDISVDDEGYFFS